MREKLETFTDFLFTIEQKHNENMQNSIVNTFLVYLRTGPQNKIETHYHQKYKKLRREYE
jgi:hypothetical protein